MPVTESELADRSQVPTPRFEFSAEQPTDQPCRTLECRHGRVAMFFRYQAACNINRKHFFKDLVLAAHDVKSEPDKDEEEWDLDNQVADQERFESPEDSHSVPKGVKEDSTAITKERRENSNEG